MFSLDADDEDDDDYDDDNDNDNDVGGDEVFLNVCKCMSELFLFFKGVAEGVFNVSGYGSCCLLKKGFFFCL